MQTESSVTSALISHFSTLQHRCSRPKHREATSWARVCGLDFPGASAPSSEGTIVYSPDWQIGEYKTCSTLNGNGDKSPEHSTRPQNIFCEGGVPSGRPEDGKVFKVRFWGRTYIKSEPFEKYMLWNCRKNGGGDPSVTCEQKAAASGATR